MTYQQSLLRFCARGPAVAAGLALALAILASACGVQSAPPPASPTPPVEALILYNWADYLPQPVLEAFTAEYGVEVIYQSYQSMEEAVENIRGGKRFDVAVLENDLILPLADRDLLARVNRQNVPNFKNIASSFRDLLFDPANSYSIPYNYGTTGLVVRTDLVRAPITRWSQLSDPSSVGKMILRTQPVETLSVVLRCLGYPLNSEDPQALEAAYRWLSDHRQSILLSDLEPDQAVDRLLNGEAAVLVGWAADAQQARMANPAIDYVLPEDGALLWGESFVISASSPNQVTAELFLNFLLRPEVSAQIANELGYASANEAAYPSISPELLDNPDFYPTRETIQRASWFLPLSPAGETLYRETWERFLSIYP